jgi:hypothetical protein
MIKVITDKGEFSCFNSASSRKRIFSERSKSQATYRYCQKNAEMFLDEWYQGKFKITHEGCFYLTRSLYQEKVKQNSKWWVRVMQNPIDDPSFVHVFSSIRLD